ncbi:cell division protein FtsZ [Ghiorsea bivora]|uniref:cell division protein FtsZ n=1 Tax=Ghiorsea bivora TaxID=1485545 RepID=UPI00056DAC25|nr:cell division protein FtsZ [Ghiorsea bivora]
MALKFTLDDTQKQVASIKVVGVGGGGGNALNNMIEQGLSGVSFVAANTDAQVLSRSLAQMRLQLGSNSTKGLGAGGKPEIGRDAAESDRAHIKELLEDTEMVFITAGMGGGTGTGAAPVIAEVAREMGILTVGVVTKPFGFEGKRRMRFAEEGIKELGSAVDTLITIPNQKLVAMAGKNTSMKDTFRMADDILFQAVRGISELITKPGYINVDFADVTAVMTEHQGMSMMGMGAASGEDRACTAAEAAITSPLLEEVDIHGAQGLLVNVTAHEDSLSMAEYEEVMSIIHNMVDEDANVNCGLVYDDDAGDELRVTVVATGLQKQETPKLAPVRPLHQPKMPIMGDVPVPGFTSGTGQAQAQTATAESPYDDLYDVPTWIRQQAD